MRLLPNPFSSGADRLRTALLALVRRGRRPPEAAVPRIVPPARPDLRKRLVDALKNDEIRPWFQPQIDCVTGAVSGAEALVRWQDPLRGLILPGAFLPAIESHDLGAELSEVVLHQALGALVSWDAAGLHVPTIAVNFTGSDLRAAGLPERVRRELQHFGLTPGRLVIEVLETVCAMGEGDQLINNLLRLEAMGCGIDLDDFGTGYASFASLRRMPVHRLKIDGAYVQQIDQDRELQKMMAAILSMARELGLETLAEGVETRGEQDCLAAMGCGFLQGYGIARPMAPETMPGWIAAHQQRSAAPLSLGQAAGR
ncbi:EAL domain-containing protein [Pseudogemmobacter faecipullorum]|uniref:EAL domain-containing protein n=1 Tax=Pseudogemmobacter faecipullorum TaxID=2755041 RepID=A0ABS8CQ87_9RHOB|nr:EAL domain-containing protein [Pseudogemmobacter faecipullorum]MCB5411561.1 EAL domain-containing protein [Pseudogemmobacter faecipullorum]